MIINTASILLIIFSAASLVLCLCFFRKYKRAAQDIAKINTACKRLRYGNIHIRIENMSSKDSEIAVNRLFETISDREMMIKEYQQTLAEKNRKLEESIKHEKEIKQAEEDFAAALTHDMKTPVTAGLNMLEYLLNGRFGALNAKQTEILNLMKTSNQELKELIENILEVYKLEHKELKLEKQNTCLNSFLAETAKEMQPIALEHNTPFVCDTAETEGVMLNFDRFQIKRAVKNLLQNAAAFSPEGCEIIIKTQKTEKEIKISVINQGQGISEKDLELIFHKCFSTPSKFRRAGTGLGLYISRAVILAHSGVIEADVSKEGFTSFTVSFKQ